jgi:hypothetical protein
MSKESFYFSHDYNTRSDEKIKNLFRKHGIAGYGIFWCIIEDLYNNANALQLDYDGIAFDLRADANVVKSIINDFDLFVIDGNYFGSTSVERRLDERNEKSAKARASAFNRWNRTKTNANAMRTQCDGNAIKERKGKGKKEDINIAKRQADFKEEVESFVENYPIEMLTAFYVYWSEPNQTKSKMKKELEKTWDTARRLVTWKNNQESWKRR